MSDSEYSGAVPTVSPGAAIPSESRRVPRGLVVALVVQSVVILVLVLALVGFLVSWGPLSWGMGGPDDEMFMLSDQVSSDVGYLIERDDVDGYMELYSAEDKSVDREAVRADFERMAAESTGTIDYMSGMQMSVYTDSVSDERILEVALQTCEPYSGVPTGPRLRVYAMQTDDGWRLTGRSGRSFQMDDTYW